MAVFRVEKTKDFTVMSNHHLRNVSLSLKAKGLLSLMLSLPDNWDYQVMYNPEVVKKSGPYETEEGCLSLTGTRPAKRWKSIKVRWQNEKFQERVKTFTGWTAQIIQHELDHCQGIVI